MLEDGVRIFVVLMIIFLPIYILAIPLVFIGLGMPLTLASINNSNADLMLIIFSLIILVGTYLILPISIPLTAVISVAEMNVIVNAGFVFLANLDGFIAAFVIYYVVSMLLAVIRQIILPTVIFFATIAQTYVAGKERLSQVKTM